MDELNDISIIEKSLRQFASDFGRTYAPDGLYSVVTKSGNPNEAKILYALYIIGRKDYNYRLLEIESPIEGNGPFNLRVFQNAPTEIKIVKPEDLEPKLNDINSDVRFKHVVQHMKTMGQIISDDRAIK